MTSSIRNDVVGNWIMQMVQTHFPGNQVEQISLLPITFSEDTLMCFEFQNKRFVSTAPIPLIEWAQKQSNVVFTSMDNTFTGVAASHHCAPLRHLCQMYCGAGCNEENITLKIKVDTLLVFLQSANVAIVTLPPAMKEWAEKYKVTELKIKNGIFTMK